jgi:hypothetical protein
MNAVRVIVLVIGFVVVLALTIAPAAAQAPSMLADDPVNAAWSVSTKTRDAVWLGGQPNRQAVVALSKSAVTPGAIEIETDAKMAIFRAPEGRALTVPLRAKETTAIDFQVTGDRPSIAVNGVEDPALRGPWIAVALHASDKLILEIPAPSYVTIRFLGVRPPPPTSAPATMPADEMVRGPRRGTAVEVTFAARAIPSAVYRRCANCSGTGEVKILIPDGVRDEGFVKREVFREEKAKCGKCNGKKIDRVRDEAVVRLAGLLVRSIASLNLEEKNAQRALSEAYLVLSDVVIRDRQTWVTLSNAGRGLIAQRQLEPGTPIVVQARFVQSIPGVTQADRSYVGIVGGTDQKVRLRCAVTAEEAQPGKFVLMGGLVSEVIQTESGERVVVLEDGFVVSPTVPKDWYWWWGTTPPEEEQGDKPAFSPD